MRLMRYGTIVLTGLLLTAFFAWADPAGRAVAPTQERPPTYWSCQDDLNSRMVVLFLSTDPPTAIIERAGKRVTATLAPSASGSKYMAPGGVLFWIKGSEATVQWPPSEKAFRCSNLAG